MIPPDTGLETLYTVIVRCASRFLLTRKGAKYMLRKGMRKNTLRAIVQ